MTALMLRRARLVYVDGLRGMRLAFGLFAVIMAVIFGGIGLIVSATGGFEGPTWTSVWEQAMYGSRYFPLSMGVVLLAAFLPVATAHGISRASYLVGTAALMVTFGVAVAVFLVAGHWIEYQVFTAGGAVTEYSSPHLFSSGREVGWVFVESVIVVTTNIVGGFFIGAAYFRWRWLRATLALPFLLVPIAAVEALMASGWAGNVMVDVLGFDRGPLGVVIPVGVAIVGAMLVATLAVLRTTDVRTSSR